jgi:hypothetical protein
MERVNKGKSICHLYGVTWNAHAHAPVDVVGAAVAAADGRVVVRRGLQVGCGVVVVATLRRVVVGAGKVVVLAIRLALSAFGEGREPESARRPGEEKEGAEGRETDGVKGGKVAGGEER